MKILCMAGLPRYTSQVYANFGREDSRCNRFDEYFREFKKVFLITTPRLEQV